MKIICIGRNYAKHIEELANERPENPVVFLKPDSAILPRKNPFFIPPFSNDVHYEVEVLIKINKVGKYIEAKFAHKYYDEIGLGKFGYRSAAAGGSWYLASLYGGPAGIAAGGAFGLGELMYDANVVSVRLRKEISMQEKHPHRIENKNIFSKGFWSEISRQMTSGNWINGFSY